MTTNRDEQEMEKELKHINKQPLPSGIDQQIFKGVARARHVKKRWEFVKHTGLSGVALLLFFVLSVNFIPGFSNVASNIPGLEKVVDLVEYDKGLQDVAKNNYVQVVDKSDTNEEVTFNIDHLIIDKRRLVFFYSIETEADYDIVGIRGAKVLDDQGEVIDEYGVTLSRVDLYKGNNSSTIDFSWIQDQEFTENMTLQLQLVYYNEKDETEAYEIEGTYDISFPVDLQKIQMSKTYDINQSASIDGQVIHFNKLESFPTRQVLYLEYDENNSKKIMQLPGLRLVNEAGETVATEDSSSLDGNKRIVSMTSNYFQDYEELYIVLDKVMAVDKDKAQVVVDLEKKQLLQAPDDRLELRDVSTDDNMFQLEDVLGLYFTFDKEEDGDEILRFEMAGFTDATGQEFGSVTNYSSTNDFGYFIEDRQYSNPITIELFQYPAYIEGDIRVRVK
ncbi:DUF4179 domain-containing protein [Radiobacillus sp. PE A8.2]|uniref:DUF4179 domain-containing protein n=1 Tax=Radiobacillus sp. PE A8.2 TaxID=3380349 RepID=UPI003890FF0E